MKLASIAREIQRDASYCFAEVLHISRLSYRKTRSILIGVLECFFRVSGLAFVHYTRHGDGKEKHFYLIMWKQFSQEDKGGGSQEPTGKKVFCLN